MNEYTIRDVIIYSTEFARIDHVLKQQNSGNRLINHKRITIGEYLLVFRPFDISKEFEKPICKKREKDDYITRLFEEAIRPKPLQEASVFQSYLKRVRDSSDFDFSSDSLTDSE